MKIKDYTGIVPLQHTGDDMTLTAAVELNNTEDAKQFYGIAKQRLLNVNNWQQIAGLVSASFQLVDNAGKEIERTARKGDFFKIDIPGPGSKAGDGYDWVKLEELTEVEHDNVQSIGLRVRPCSNPVGQGDDTAHFYSENATSNFIVTREHNKIYALIIDRNLEPNENAHSITDKLRDTAVGLSAISIFSKIQWQRLANGLVKTS